MGDEHDEPLEGDIGPAASRPAPFPGTEPSGTASSGRASMSAAAGPEAAAESRRYEAEREERRRSTDAVSGRIAAAATALFLAFLIYDSVDTAVEAHGRGDDWIYPPAVIAVTCAIALVTLLAWAVRRVK
ncbi:hypothetical protein [Actinomadura sp. 9N215]|uniref:hypothetical protein n=1 Tax=Actinomadura sp. 9N215 TaxID=3375150 RepID=UPI0037968E11